jgi:hypothetical protein
VKVRPNVFLRAGESATVIPLEDAAIIVLVDDDNDDEDDPRSPIPLLVDNKAWRLAPKTASSGVVTAPRMKQGRIVSLVFEVTLSSSFRWLIHRTESSGNCRLISQISEGRYRRISICQFLLF